MTIVINTRARGDSERVRHINIMQGKVGATREWLEKESDIQLTHYRDFGISGKSFVVQKLESI